jgi:nitrogen fixation/metabolism regulation signal transduction histidine kinase
LSSSLKRKIKNALVRKLLHLGRLQLKQCINLFSNAGEAMKDGGTLSITVASTKLDGDNALSVTVSDTGGGIPVEILHISLIRSLPQKSAGRVWGYLSLTESSQIMVAGYWCTTGLVSEPSSR